MNTAKPVVKAAVSDEDVQKQIKETLSRLTSKGSKTNSSKRRNYRTKAKTKKAKKTVRSKSSFMANSGKYAPGTIIRSNGILYHLDNSRQWLRV